MFRRSLSRASVAAVAVVVGLTTGTVFAGPPNPLAVRPAGAHPVVPGAAQIGRYPYHGFAGVRPGASFSPYYSFGLYGYPPRFNFGYANSSFALSIGVGNPWGYAGYFGYRSPLLVANPVPYYVPYYVPVPTAPPGEPLVPEVPPATGESNYRPAVPTPPPPAPLSGAARITVQVPAGARVWVDDQATAQTGAVREFVTPATLEPGRTYQYKLRAQWEQNGQTVTRERMVEFKAGGAVIVNFNAESR
jgi:uncharacterized protein (TIGR03000 family)